MCKKEKGGINSMNYRELQEMQKLNRLKEENDCLVCEIVIPRKFKEGPKSVIYGTGEEIEMAMLIKMLREVSDNMEYNFPEVKKIIPLLKKKELRESYKNIEFMKE